jgi:mono/diheme cytochrome c family protein
MRTWRSRLASTAVAAGLPLAAMALAACSTEETPAAPEDPVLAEGQTIFNSNCASCHGRSGGGGGIGPALAGRVEEQYPDIEAQKQVIREGMGGMPGFESRLTPEQIDAVARYTREVL